MKSFVSRLRALAQTYRQAYTVVEVIVVIVALGTLAGITTMSIRSWHDRAATTEVKWDINGLMSAMKNARNWSTGYPVFEEGTTFDGKGDTSKVYTQSRNVRLTYYQGNASSYCIEAQSVVRPGVYFYVDTSTGDMTPKRGTCVSGAGGVPVPMDSAQTLFVVDTRLSGCSGTVQLPIAAPAGASGSLIVWGDGITGPLLSAYPTHTYSKAGRYVIAYNGPITGVDGAGVAGSSRPCLTQLKQWGQSTAPTRVNFQGSSNLSYVAEPPQTVTDMEFMFKGASVFNQDISSWDMSRITRTKQMFQDAVAFNQPIGAWNTSKVWNMMGMFSNARAFNQPLNTWNVSAVTDMGAMFAGATAFNQPLSNWNTANVTNMNEMFGSYSNMAFNQPIGNWNTAKVTNMDCMFCARGGAFNVFNQNVSTWNVSSVTSHVNFRGGSALTAANSPAGW